MKALQLNLLLLCLNLPACSAQSGTKPQMDTTMRTSTISTIPTKVSKIRAGVAIAEGLLLHPSGQILFTEVREGKIFLLDPATDKAEVLYEVNGMPARLGFTPDGDLLFTDHENRNIRRVDASGEITEVVGRYRGHRFNSPMTPLYTQDGSLLFTDPNFLKYGEKEVKQNGLYRLSTNGTVDLLSAVFADPNALLMNATKDRLYVGDYGRNQLWVFDLAKNGDLSAGKLLIDLAKHGITGHGLDGACFGPEGNIYLTGGKGVNVFTSSGILVGIINFPEFMCNLAWDVDGKTLYAGGYGNLYKVEYE